MSTLSILIEQTFDFLSIISSVVCKSSEFNDAEHGSLYLDGHAHNGWVQFNRM